MRAGSGVRLILLAGALVLACAGGNPVSVENHKVLPTQTVGSEPAPVHIILQDESSSPLSTYDYSFWAKNEESSDVEIKYEVLPGEFEDFMTLKIPEGGIAALPGGAALPAGDSVLVTIQVNANRFLVKLLPAGLRFTLDDPATIEFSYEHADPDFDRDGDIDTDDEAIRTDDLGITTRSGPGSTWQPTVYTHDTVSKKIGAPVPIFENIAVSW